MGSGLHATAHGLCTSRWNRMQTILCWESIWLTNSFYGCEVDIWGWRWHSCSNYSNSQFSNQNRQDVISRVSAVQESARGPRWKHSQSSGSNLRSHQQCRLRRDGKLRPPATSSGGTSMTAYILQKSQNTGTGLSRLTKKRWREHAVATRRVSKNLQQGRSGGEGTRYTGDNTSQKKSGYNLDRVVFRKSFLGRQATGWGRNECGYADRINLRI